MPTPLNLIIFLTDNHARSMAGCYGHPIVKTPNLDNIAETGTKFENAYCASSLCCPSRAAIATGLYPHQTGYWDNALVFDGQQPSWHGQLKNQGNSAVAIGKLHYLSKEIDQGFSDELVTMHIAKGTGDLIGLLRATDGGVPERPAFREMYAQSGEGTAPYQNYDFDVTSQAVNWLQTEAHRLDEPWVLLVSYASPHPPFTIPKRFYDLYPVEDVPMPVQWEGGSRPDHPALNHIRRLDCLSEPLTEEFVRRTVAGYCGLVSHVDEQIGAVMEAARGLGMMDDLRIIYTSDHGEAAGNHGLLGKTTLYEHSLGVPLLISGPDVPHGQEVKETVSHVDLYDTILESTGCPLGASNHSRFGRSLWPMIDGEIIERLGFAEVHVKSTKSAAFMLRDGDLKLIYHVDAPSQLFDLGRDPLEMNDLGLCKEHQATREAMEKKLRRIVDPEAVDAHAKSDQLQHTLKYGGEAIIRNEQNIVASPPPV
jgi:choline-sulfatase